MKKSTFWRCFL